MAVAVSCYSFNNCEVYAMSHAAVQSMYVALQMLLLYICTIVDCIRVDKLQLGGMEGAPTPQDYEPAVGKNKFLIVDTLSDVLMPHCI